MMRRAAVTLAGVFLCFSCAEREQESTGMPAPMMDAEAPTASCTPESRCAGCTSCFDQCLCGGGATARCAEECSAAPDPTEPGDSGPSVVAPPPPSPFVATVVVDAFDIAPGEEAFKCQNFRNPFGHNVAVLSTESFMTAGSHHLLVFQRSEIDDGELEDCSGLEFSAYLHLAQQSQKRTGYPPDVGRLLTIWEGLRVQVHYLNTSSDTIHTEVAVTLQADLPEAVPMHASQIFINTFGISVPPRGEGRAENSCSVPKDVHVFSGVSHMHHHGVYFTARSDDGQLLYETNEWAEPTPWDFDPPRFLPEGSTIRIECEYLNNSDEYLSFGESAASNEMCIFAGAYYPAEFAEGITCLF